MKDRTVAPASAGDTSVSPARGVIWLLLSLLLIVLVFLPILVQ